MKCKYCNSTNLAIKQTGIHIELFCADCLKFQKFITKKEVERFKSLKFNHEKSLENTKNKLKILKDALYSIFIDYSEDNPDRHLNPISASEVAANALRKIGEKIE